MSDLIDREDAISYVVSIFPNLLRNLPSADPERTAKVIEHDVTITTDDGQTFHRTVAVCGNCKKNVMSGDDYCSHCGARLEWE